MFLLVKQELLVHQTCMDCTQKPRNAVLNHLRDILPGNIDFTTRTLTFSSTTSKSLTEVIRARVMFEICSNPL